MGSYHDNRPLLLDVQKPTSFTSAAQKSFCSWISDMLGAIPCIIFCISLKESVPSLLRSNSCEKSSFRKFGKEMERKQLGECCFSTLTAWLTRGKKLSPHSTPMIWAGNEAGEWKTCFVRRSLNCFFILSTCSSLGNISLAALTLATVGRSWMLP